MGRSWNEPLGLMFGVAKWRKSTLPSLFLTSLSLNICDPAVPRTPPRNVQVYNPTPNSLNVRWEPASGQVQQYRVAYTSQTGATGSVSNFLLAVKTHKRQNWPRGTEEVSHPPNPPLRSLSLLTEEKDYSKEYKGKKKKQLCGILSCFKQLWTSAGEVR